MYTEVTSTLEKRMFEHKSKEAKESFTAKYNINKLIYYHTFSNPKDAIVAEKKIKGWKRKRKIELIESINPKWKDLFELE